MDNVQHAIAEGLLAKQGLLDHSAIQLAADVIQRIEEHNIETVRVLFTDQHGILRGKTIVANKLVSVFRAGMTAPSTLILKDTAHNTTFPVWSALSSAAGELTGACDVLMVPDPATFRRLPWSPHSAWLMCDLRFKSGDLIPFAPRTVLKQAIDKLAMANKKLIVGLEVEFHVFELVNPKLAHRNATMPGQAVETRNLAQGYQLLTESRYDQLESIMDTLRRYSLELGLPLISMEVEMGPSQFEFTFDPSDPMTHADNMIMFRTMVKEACTRQGLHATFMCKPNVDNAAASGWHLHQSLIDKTSGKNLMMPTADESLTAEASSWIAGLLEHASACSLLTTPTVNGYKRYQPHQLAPDRIQWASDNRGAMIRGLMSAGDEASRVENRVAEPAANPYYFFASQLLSGLDGLDRELVAPEAADTPYDSAARKLPASLISAIDQFENSEFIRREFGDVFVDYLSCIHRAEWERFHQTISHWEQNEYFNLF
ncbi:MAG: glutamine synthetase family protein [Granulosicoccus sp.]